MPRLLVLANERWASLTSLTYLSLSIHVAHIVLLLALVIRIFGRQTLALGILAGTILLDLMLAPLQMENFVWSLQIAFLLVYAAATVSIVLLTFSKGRWPILASCIAFALISSYTMANGILLWPVLVALAAYLRLRRPVLILFGAIGGLVIASYVWHYQLPSLGMGVAGMVRDPLHSVALLGLVLAGPLDFISTPGGIVAALVALAIIAYLAIQALRDAAAPPGLSALIAMLLFLLLTCLSIVAGRLDPRFLERPHGNFILQSRHFTPIYLFWACVAPLVAYTCWNKRRRPILAGLFGLIFVWFLFGARGRQLSAAEGWPDFFVGVDAVGGAILLQVPDEQFLSVLWPAPAERDTLIAFLRHQHLAFFSEPRATWFGKSISELFPGEPGGGCSGEIEQSVKVGADGSWRVQGWAVDRKRGTAPKDILFTDANGRIVGFARGGLQHDYFPGLMVQTTSLPVPSLHAQSRRSEWLGYLRMSGDARKPGVRIYGLLPHSRLCTVTP
jgi:hypothetical protein